MPHKREAWPLHAAAPESSGDGADVDASRDQFGCAVVAQGVVTALSRWWRCKYSSRGSVTTSRAARLN